MKSLYITNRGIKLSNLEYNKSKSWNYRVGPNLVKREKSFYYWNEIKEMEFFSKATVGGRASLLRDYLLIKTKNGETVHCLIHNYKGFIRTIRELGKFNLFNKESKYIRPTIYRPRKKKT